MKIEIVRSNVYNEPAIFEAIRYEESDIPSIQEGFEYWIQYRNHAKKNHGRSPNIPEFITEACLCLITNSVRFKKRIKIKDSSFDCFKIETERTQQAKAGSVKIDCTSFGPKSKWDDLYFMDFYNNGNLDGTFDLYLIPNELIYSLKTSKNITFVETQQRGLRPHIRLKKDVIIPNQIEPIEKKVKLWSTNVKDD